MFAQQPVPYPSNLTIPSNPPGPSAGFRFFAGVDWPMLIGLFDPRTGQPLAIPQDTTFYADLFFAASAKATFSLTEANNGVQAIDRVNSAVLLLVPRTVTVNALPSDTPAYAAPLTVLPGYGQARSASAVQQLDNRVVVYAVSGDRTVQPVAAYTIEVDNLRTIDQSYFQENQVAFAVSTITTIVNGNVLRGTQFKRGMEAVDPGSAQAMFTSGLFQANESDPDYLTWRDDYAPLGGALDQLYLKWLQSPAGLNLSPGLAAQRLTAVRAAALQL